MKIVLQFQQLQMAEFEQNVLPIALAGPGNNILLKFSHLQLLEL
jgi:hypothetical protein